MLPTSREFDVLSSEMEVDKNFSASGLKEDGAWDRSSRKQQVVMLKVQICVITVSSVLK